MIKRPHITEQEQEDIEKIYYEHIKDGFLLITYIGEPPQYEKDRTSRYHKMIRDRFGEDSEITKYLIQERKGFITGD